MAANFPNSPSNGQTFTSNGVTFTWDGTAWKQAASPGVKGTKGEVGDKGEVGFGQKGEVGGDGNKGEPGFGYEFEHIALNPVARDEAVTAAQVGKAFVKSLRGLEKKAWKMFIHDEVSADTVAKELGIGRMTSYRLKDSINSKAKKYLKGYYAGSLTLN